MKYIIGADIGGTTIKLGLFDQGINLIESWTIPTNKSTNAKDYIFSDIEKSCLSYLNKNNINIKDLLGLGIGIPGPVVNDTIANDCANISLPKDLYVPNQFNLDNNIIISVGNDANMALLGEYAYDKSIMDNDVAMLTIGTGVGGALISNGSVISGSIGAAGEIGHIPVPNIFLEDFKNNNFSELEHLTSGINLERLAGDFLLLDKYKSSILHKIGHSPKEIYENPDDILSQTLIKIYSKYFSMALSYLCGIVNPSKIFIGGGMSKAHNFLNTISKDFSDLTWPYSRKNVELITAKLEDLSGIYGCAASVLVKKYGKTFLDIMKIVGWDNIKLNILGKDITTFKIGGPIKYFVSPNNVDDLSKLLAYCNKTSIKYFIIGQGSNILITDEGYNGIIISLINMVTPLRANNSKIIAPAATTLKEISEFALENSLSGLEFAHDIPGSVGGGVSMNCGAYNGEIKDVIISATVITNKGEVKILNKEELELEHRNSIVKKNKYVVVSAEFELMHSDKISISNYMNELYQKRIDKQPLEYPSAGCIFKRPPGHFAGKLIMDSNLKGFSIGGATVSSKHAGFIINENNATSKNVESLIDYIQSTVNKNFNVMLETELIIVK